MWKKIAITSLVAIGAVSCAYNRPVDRGNDEARVQRETAPQAPRARPMGEGEMETPGIDSPDTSAPTMPNDSGNMNDMPVTPDSGSNEPAPGSTISPSTSDDDILSPLPSSGADQPADDTDAVTPGEAPTPPDAMAPTPGTSTDDSAASGSEDSAGDASGDTSGDTGDSSSNGSATKDGKKKSEPGRGEGEGESDADDDTSNMNDESDQAAPGDAEIDEE